MHNRAKLAIATVAVASFGALGAAPAAQADITVCVGTVSVSVLGQEVVNQQPGCTTIDTP